MHGRLGGFHFNDSKYGDDDLDAGSIEPFRLFLVFNELVEAELAQGAGLRAGAHARPVAQRHRSDRKPDDQRHRTAERAYAQALIVDRKALHEYRIGNDVLMAAQTLKRGFTTDVSAILAQARVIERARPSTRSVRIARAVIARKCAEMRPGKQSLGGGIVCQGMSWTAPIAKQSKRRRPSQIFMPRCSIASKICASERRRVPRAIFDYADRGSYDEVTFNRNLVDLARHPAAPARAWSTCRSSSSTTTILGETLEHAAGHRRPPASPACSMPTARC